MLQVNAIKIAKEKLKQNGETSSTVTKENPPTGTAEDNSEKESVVSQESEDSIPVQERSLLQKIVRTKLINSKCDIEVQRKDPNSPLYSVKSFEALHL